MGVLIILFHNVHVCQNSMLYTLHIYTFYLSVFLNEAGDKKVNFSF